MAVEEENSSLKSHGVGRIDMAFIWNRYPCYLGSQQMASAPMNERKNTQNYQKTCTYLSMAVPGL